MAHPLESYRAIRAELGSYEPSLLERREIVALNKVDLLPEREALDAVERAIARDGRPVQRISSATGEGVGELLALVVRALDADEEAA